MITSNECTNLFKSLIAASAELGNVAKTKQAYGYKYAPFDSIIDMLRLTLPKHHLWFTQDVSNDGDKYVLETLVLHDSGEWLKSSMTMTNTELSGKANETQQLGASITYFKRYVLSALFGIATDEDVDGNVEAFQRKQEVKANAKAAKRPDSENAATDNSSQPKINQTSDQEGKAKRARNYVLQDMAKRIESGISPEKVVKYYADLLKTDEQRSPENIPDDEICLLGNTLFKINKSSK